MNTQIDTDDSMFVNPGPGRGNKGPELLALEAMAIGEVLHGATKYHCFAAGSINKVQKQRCFITRTTADNVLHIKRIA